MEGRDFDYYEARAQEVKLEDITSCADNAEILHMLRDNNPYLTNLHISNIAITTYVYEFIIGEGDDLGWLGYFIGCSERLKTLGIKYLPQEREQTEALMEGINRNQSIRKLITRDFGGASFRNLSPFLRSNNNFADLQLVSGVGLECAQSIALALGASPCESLKNLVFEGCDLDDEGFAEIAAALSIQPQLEVLRFENNNIGSMGCIALGATIRGWGASSLKSLDLDNNAIDDRGLQALVAGMTNTTPTLEKLLISDNLITAVGLRSLRTYFQSEGCTLRQLSLYRMNFGDEGAVSLADGLMGNKSLKCLYFDSDDSGITDVGWAAFSKLLCDPSSINSTYLSNHTLEVIDGAPPNIEQYLTWNELGHPATCKILKSHPDIDMEPFFQWKLKFLPVLINWFEGVRSSMSNDLGESLQSVQDRELSAVYKFVRAMPDLVVVSTGNSW